MPAASRIDRKSTRLNSSHSSISYAVFCLKKKTGINEHIWTPLAFGLIEDARTDSERRPTVLFFFIVTATTEIYTLSLHDALPISNHPGLRRMWLRIHDVNTRRAHARDD